MKKIVICFIALAIISNCSSREDNSNVEVPVLPTKVIIDGKAYTYSYMGDKIKEITSGNSVTRYTYNGDYIIKEEDYEDNQFKSSNEFIYSNGRLASTKVTEKWKELHEPLVYNINYQYIDNHHVRYNGLQGVTINNGVASDIKYAPYDFYFDDNGNPIRFKKTYEGANVEIISTFDTKNNPYRNIRGLSLLISLEILERGNNNAIKHETITDSEVTPQTFTYTYNRNGYPITMYQNGNPPTGASTIVTYEYNK
ncbi:hypothetical protein D1631_18430 [Chryseobacterium nematophagum]|uniref:DUF4595 domain-containing protein n=1 Tax=Chryseobacterium nematophagum TaxID=2305228 RepID=A0A3M7TB56_9FLAO|nr:hypothetical protein [Chryseobacterium nematophagum]RNA60471.1 hypothetical protein D1631_18430 [Chryseobacterium nematophagum]